MHGHFTPDHHFGFEAAAWYWHFVDVVWLFLFVCIYWWGGGSAASRSADAGWPQMAERPAPSYPRGFPWCARRSAAAARAAARGGSSPAC